MCFLLYCYTSLGWKCKQKCIYQWFLQFVRLSDLLWVSVLAWKFSERISGYEFVLQNFPAKFTRGRISHVHLADGSWLRNAKPSIRNGNNQTPHDMILIQYFNEDMILLQFLMSEYCNNLRCNLSPFFERKLFLTVKLCKWIVLIDKDSFTLMATCWQSVRSHLMLFQEMSALVHSIPRIFNFI